MAADGRLRMRNGRLVMKNGRLVMDCAQPTRRLASVSCLPPFNDPSYEEAEAATYPKFGPFAQFIPGSYLVAVSTSVSVSSTPTNGGCCGGAIGLVPGTTGRNESRNGFNDVYGEWVMGWDDSYSFSLSTVVSAVLDREYSSALRANYVGSVPLSFQGPAYYVRTGWLSEVNVPENRCSGETRRAVGTFDVYARIAVACAGDNAGALISGSGLVGGSGIVFSVNGVRVGWFDAGRIQPGGLLYPSTPPGWTFGQLLPEFPGEPIGQYEYSDSGDSLYGGCGVAARNVWSRRFAFTVFRGGQ